MAIYRYLLFFAMSEQAESGTPSSKAKKPITARPMDLTSSHKETRKQGTG